VTSDHIKTLKIAKNNCHELFDMVEGVVSRSRPEEEGDGGEDGKGEEGGPGWAAHTTSLHRRDTERDYISNRILKLTNK